MPSFCGGVLITWTDEGGSDKENASCKAFSRCNYWSITSSQRLLARGQLGALGQQWRSHSALAAVTLCMSHWHATLIYYTIPALENSNKFFKVILWLALLMFPFTPPLLLLIASSSPPKHSDSSSPHSVLWTLQHLQYPAHRTGWEHPKCIKSSIVSPEGLLGLLPVSSSPTHSIVTGPKILEVGGARSQHQPQEEDVHVRASGKYKCSVPSLTNTGKQILDWFILMSSTWLLLYNRHFFPNFFAKLGF